jgi:hypothetical protein
VNSTGRERLGKLALALLGVALASQLFVILERARVDRLEPRDLNPGEAIENVQFGKYATPGQRASHVSLVEVVGGRCAVLFFFDSACPYCEQLAEGWADVTEVEHDGISVPILWASILPDDPEAPRFIDRFRLPFPWLYVRGREDRMSLGITATPAIYLVSPGGVFEQHMPREKAVAVALPPVCKNAR